jgi:hypothetical protein
MTKPDRRSTSQPPLLVEAETSPGSGEFAVEERLRPDEVEMGSDTSIASATISVRLDNNFDGAAARNRYLPDLRLIVRTDHPDPTQRVILFEGYPSQQVARSAGGPRSAEQSYTFLASGVYDVLSRDRRAWIHGRYMRNARIIDGLAADPQAWQAKSVLVEALPCVFNPDGLGNCSPDPLQVTAPDGTARSLFIFTYDGDPDAVHWTFLNALRYLVWFYRLSEGPVAEGNVFSDTDAHVSRGVDDTESAPAETGLLRALLARPDSLNCEATNLVEALGLLADECDIHVTPMAINDGGRLGTELHVWSPQDAPAQSIHLARGGRHADGTARYDANQATARDVFEANEIHKSVIRWDQRRIVNAPIVIGDVRVYEMTVPLVPGWLPTTDLDNVDPPDREAAKSLALTPEIISWLGDDAELYEWYRRYHKNGSLFDQYRDVARTWVLNEDGHYDGATYNRNAPFDDYHPFDFSTVAGASVTTAGQWTRRPRPLQTTITVDTNGQDFGVYVEVSFDSGSTWSEPQGSVNRLTDRAGIYFAISNPTAITPPGELPEIQNLWYAIIDQTFRVRVTAVFDADERLSVHRAPDDARTPTLRTTSRIVYRPTQYKFASREGTTNVLADVNPDATDINRDDHPAVAALAEKIAQREQDEQILVTPAIPWLDTRFPIGTRITGIRGRGIPLGSRVAQETTGPVVVGKRFRLSGGRYETELILEATSSAG